MIVSKHTPPNMPDSIQVTSSSSWFSRLGKAFTGIVVGIIFIIVGIALLFWNEGREAKAPHFQTLLATARK